jgi:hypothetical protein
VRVGDWTLRLGTGIAAAVLLLLLVVQGAALTLSSGGGDTLAGCDVTALATGADSPDLTGEQTVNATTILTVAQQRQLPPRAAVIAIATALQESRLRNLDDGDRDSLGLFQQRPSQGWGDTPTGPNDHRTPEQRITDPAYAATAFYTRLTTIDGWQKMALTVAAQAVQNSGHPGAYAHWEPLATRIVAALSAQTCLDDVSLVGSPTAAAATAMPEHNWVCPTNGPATVPRPGTSDSTAPASPTPPTKPPASSSRAPPRLSTTPSAASPPGKTPRPATSSSTAPAPPTSPTLA